MAHLRKHANGHLMAAGGNCNYCSDAPVEFSVLLSDISDCNGICSVELTPNNTAKAIGVPNPNGLYILKQNEWPERGSCWWSNTEFGDFGTLYRYNNSDCSGIGTPWSLDYRYLAVYKLSLTSLYCILYYVNGTDYWTVSPCVWSLFWFIAVVASGDCDGGVFANQNNYYAPPLGGTATITPINVSLAKCDA